MRASVHSLVIGPEAETAEQENCAQWEQPQRDGECGQEKVSIRKLTGKTQVNRRGCWNPGVHGGSGWQDGGGGGAERALGFKKLCEQEAP